MLNSLIMAAAVAAAQPVLELDFTKGAMPPDTVSAVSKKFVNTFDRPKFVKEGKEYALFCGGKNQYGHFAVTDKSPFKAQTPFTVTCSFMTRGGWCIPVVYYRSGWNSKDGFSIMQNGPQLHLQVGKELIISSGKQNPLQSNTRYFVTVSWDGKTWKMTLNGRELETKKNPPFILPPADIKLHIGGYNIHTNNVFEGTIRKVRIYDHALSADELHVLLEKELSELEKAR